MHMCMSMHMYLHVHVQHVHVHMHMHRYMHVCMACARLSVCALIAPQQPHVVGARRMERWCWLEQNLGLASVGRTAACGAENRSGRLPPSGNNTAWLNTAKAREQQRVAQRDACRRSQRSCELSFHGQCSGSPGMSATSGQTRRVQYATEVRGRGRMNEQMLCRRRAEAWQRTCGTDAQVRGQIVTGKALANCGGKWEASGLRFVAPPPPPPPPAPRPGAAKRFQGFRLARTPDPFPVYKPARCRGHTSQIPMDLWQTGRGSDRRAHNKASAAAARVAHELMGEGLKLHWHNDSAARTFVAERCPRAIRAYDCLKPHAYKADLWRYCVMWVRGGIYLDAEDVPLVPLKSLLRPCDNLVLARDWCPGLHKAANLTWWQKWGPCDKTSVQISFMAAAPGQPFFQCALHRAVRNIEAGYYGPGDLFVTGPPLAGLCLDRHRADYTMEIAQGKGALFVGDTPVIRTHAWSSHATPATNGTLSSATGYARLWRRRDILKRWCSVRDGKLVVKKEVT